MPFRLKVLAGRDHGQVYLLPPTGTLTIGRGEANVALTDPRVSRSHFRISLAGGQVRILDLDSLAGILVNNEPAVQEQPLRAGDIIVAGDTYLQLLGEASPSRSSAPTAVPAMGKPASAETMLRQPPPSTARLSNPGLPLSTSATRPPAHASTSVRRSLGEASALAELANTPFGVFALGSVLGVGRTGATFRAADTRDRTEVALKVFVPRFSRREESVARLTLAVKTIHPLKHLNLVGLHGAGRSEGSCWLSSELVEGPSVAWLVTLAQAGQGDWRAGLRVATDVARALMYLHGKDVLHRNLTPENLLVRRADGMVLVGDALMVRSRNGSLAQNGTSEGLVSDIRYVAPELALGDPSAGDHRSDLYSLGAVLYAVLTGKPPIEGEDPLDTAHQLHTAEPTPVRQLVPSVPLPLETAVMRLLAKNPDQRFQNAADLLRALLAVDRPTNQPTWLG